MSRLIDADKISFYGLNECICPDLTAQDVIDNVPTVEAIPIVYGEWEPTITGFYVIHRCADGNIVFGLNGWHYCPNCGAKMDDEHRESEDE